MHTQESCITAWQNLLQSRLAPEGSHGRTAIVAFLQEPSEVREAQLSMAVPGQSRLCRDTIHHHRHGGEGFRAKLAEVK